MAGVAAEGVPVSDRPRLSDAMFAYHVAESLFSDAMVAAGFGDYESVGGDEYDNSIEFYRVGNDERMGEKAQRVVFDAGFSKAYVNHKDGWETHYSWDHSEPFKVKRGWRRRWVADPTAKTTNAIGEPLSPDNAGYFEISRVPEDWGAHGQEWLKTGYMRVVPDPLAQACP